MMTAEDRRILGLFAARVRERFPDSRILAYGSRARGEATWESDFDICVILPRIDREIERAISEISWEVGFDNDVVIIAVEFDEETFLRQAKGRIPFVNNILKDAVAA